MISIFTGYFFIEYRCKNLFFVYVCRHNFCIILNLMNDEIIKKFGIEKYNQKLFLNIPAGISDFDGMSFCTTQNEEKYDLIFAFVFSLNEFVDLLKSVIDNHLLNPGGVIYFAYPKKGNKQYKEYIGRDDFFEVVNMDDGGYINESPIKFNKMAALNDVFTVVGLKHEPTRKKSTQPSQCVMDYVERVPEIRKYFENKNDVLTLFDQLTPGYQRNWARYVFSVKNPVITDKRFAEMEHILKQGFKSLDLYRRCKK